MGYTAAENTRNHWQDEFFCECSSSETVYGCGRVTVIYFSTPPAVRPWKNDDMLWTTIRTYFTYPSVLKRVYRGFGRFSPFFPSSRRVLRPRKLMSFGEGRRRG